MLCKKVLLIEDDPKWITAFRNAFQTNPHLKDVEVIIASCLTAARECFGKYPDIILVSVDGILNGAEIKDTMKFVQRIRHTGYEGPMIAASGDERFRKLLVQSGCNHSYPKEDLVEGIATVLLSN